MRDDAPSLTAAWVAAARGLGSLLPAEARLVDDPYGVAFASPRIGRLVARGGVRALLAIPGLTPWVLYMQVRTRVLDDAVRAFATRGGRQLVLLGAGYDCRALRLPEIAAVFEVDHPATQCHKRATLARLGAASPARYLTWDFETRPMDELPEALAQAGHDPTRPTLTIWEGVTMYLTEGAIDASLHTIRTYSAPGSQLAMTYFAKDRLVRPSLATRAIQALVRGAGEPWRWGWNPRELPDFLADRDFTLERDVTMAEAARELLPASHARLLAEAADRRVAISRAGESIAVAR